MQLFRCGFRFVQRNVTASSNCAQFRSTRSHIGNTGPVFCSSESNASAPVSSFGSIPKFVNQIGSQTEGLTRFSNGMRPVSMLFGNAWSGLCQSVHSFPSRCMTTEAESVGSVPMPDVAPRIKFKRLDKTAKHIMQILDKEAVEEVKEKRDIPDIKPGYIVQLRVEAPENKRRVSVVKGIVIARRNAGLNTTFRIRRLVAGVGVESLFPLYSPCIKEIKVLDKKKVRRAKLYYLRDKMNALKKH